MSFLDTIYNEYYPSDARNVGIKMSGGADTGLLFYYTAKHISENNLKQTLHPFTIVEASAPFQLLFSRAIIDYTLHRFPQLDVSDHLVHHFSGDGPDKIPAMQKFVIEHFNARTIDVILSGITAAPKCDDFAEQTKNYNPPSDARGTTVEPVRWIGTNGDNRNYFFPMINHDKRDVASEYERLGILDLYERTRSCVLPATDFSKHCGECWWCAERLWAFGKL